MEINDRAKYFRAKRKVEALKHFYLHLIVFFIINTVMILVTAGIFNNGSIDLSQWPIFIPTIF